MSKGHDAGAKEHKAEHKPEAKAAEGKAEHKGEHKAEGAKPEQKSASASAEPKKKGKGHEPLPGGCFAWGCKVQAKRFNFCDEHYDHFKFGLIKKTGEPVSDYEKKIEHYTAYLARTKKNAQKAA